MVREKESRFLTTHLNPPSFTDGLSEEFHESDVVWTSDDHPTFTTTTAPALRPIRLHATPSVGLSAALFSPEAPASPTSIKRKTTSPPVSMISSPLSRSSDGGSFYSRKFHQSAPVNVPVWPTKFGPRTRVGFGPAGSSMGWFEEEEEGKGDGDGLQEDGEMVPPHEIVARSHRTTTFSVIEGAGRTLKGRDLTRVRNAVFQKTGFL